MKEECLICKAPLEYLNEDIEMECELCHKKEKSKTRCINGHYVCNECHMQGIDSLIGLCLNETSGNPVAILNKMMSMPFCHMHGPEHHVMVGMALLTAYKNCGGEIDLKRSLIEMNSRGSSVPGGACGFWGACGAGISAGMFISIVTGSTPLGKDNFGLSHKMTARALEAIGEVGGPRCCKRDSYLSISRAIDFVKESLGIEMEKSDVVCTYSSQNNQCIGKRCPFSRVNAKKKKIAFLCVHNSCRSQIAEALGRKYLSDRYECYSAGTEVKPQINPDAVRLMKQEYGIDMEKDQYPKLLEDIPEADIYVSMGCNVACPNIPGKKVINWGLDDPTGKEDEEFMDVIRQIEKKYWKWRKNTVPAGTRVRLAPGESITIQPYLYHDYHVETGTGPVLLGEVSMCNDDENDCEFYINFPVMLSGVSRISSGVPAATILPPASPPPGPMSMT